MSNFLRSVMRFEGLLGPWLAGAVMAGAVATWIDGEASEPDLSDRYVALAIQGDLRAAPALFEADDRARSVGGDALARQFRERFQTAGQDSGIDSGDPLVNAVVQAYHRYWRSMLMGENRPSEGETALRAELRKVLALGQPSAAIAEEADIYGLAHSTLTSRGFHSVFSLAPPLQDLFVWRQQEPRSFQVELTDQEREVRVVFLSEFSSLGWKDYASLGLATTTGWVEDGTLYCVEWAYLPESENFEVSFLKHETRHLADFERFPGLSSAELEYRAKLTELAFASSTLPRLLEDFSAKAAPNPDSPHAAANQRLLEDLHQALWGTPYPGDTKAWTGISAPKINRSARRLLEQDTLRLGHPPTVRPLRAPGA